MKTPSTFLFDLLKSLTGPELRYLKVQLGQINSGYSRLMDAVLGQDNYDEAALKVVHAKDGFIKNLSVNKRYLIDWVLVNLGRFKSKEKTKQVIKHLSFAQLLKEKSFPKESRRELYKAQKKAKGLDWYEGLLLTYELEKQLLATRCCWYGKGRGIAR